MCNCYILFCPSRNIYYTGSTKHAVENRLEKHLSIFYGFKKFTAHVKDWEIYLIIPCDTLTEARKIEFHIKRMKSTKYIKNLKKYPEILERLRSKYSSQTKKSD